MRTPYRAALEKLPPHKFLMHIETEGPDAWIQLGQNESGTAAGGEALSRARAAMNFANRYPDVSYTPLRHAIAEARGLEADRIVCGAGSLELLNLLTNIYGGDGAEVVASQFTYNFFLVQCAIHDLATCLVPEPEFCLDVDGFVAAVTDRTRMAFVVNPSNPTGMAMPQGELRRLRDALPERVLLVVDGAYAEFAEAGRTDFDNGFDLVDEGRNVVVLRTFSKAYGMAGLRVGWCYGTRDVVSVLRKVQCPCSIAMPSAAAAIEAMRDQGPMNAARDAVLREREDLNAWLENRSFDVLPSAANFVAVKCPATGPWSAEALLVALNASRIMVRPLDNYGMANFLRISIGSAGEMAALRQVIEGCKSG